MELNGIANIKLLVSDALKDERIDQTTKSQIDDQLDVLERYMLTIAETLRKFDAQHDYPHWHEVRDNRKAYKTMRERMAR